MKALDHFVKIHKSMNDGQRLGQRFCNMFIKGAWPDLYYEENDAVAREMIRTWLSNHHYHDELPGLSEE